MWDFFFSCKVLEKPKAEKLSWQFETEGSLVNEIDLGGRIERDLGIKNNCMRLSAAFEVIESFQEIISYF
jgi:hypothetical protein